MQKIKLHFVGIILVCIAFAGILASQSSKKLSEDISQNIPADFSKYKAHILVMKYDESKKMKRMDRVVQRKLNRKISTSIVKYYKGKYDFVVLNKDFIREGSKDFVVKNPLYLDINKNRYILYTSYEYSINKKGKPADDLQYYILGLYDRKTKINYHARQSIGPKKLVEIYMKKLEEARQ